MKKQILNKIKELKWERYLREEAVKALMYEGVDGIILMLPYLFKYEYEEFPDFFLAKKIQKENLFYVSIGEYRGWKKVCYQYAEPKDIFQEFLEKDFSFMVFQEQRYLKKRFAGQKLGNVRFQDCIFLNTTFYDVNFMDAIFENCVFRECMFMKCILSGCEFRNCDIQRIEWTENKTESGLILEQDKVIDVCRPTGFYQCILHKHRWKETNKTECVLESCDIEDMWEDEDEIL